jgi:hypothetical protein
MAARANQGERQQFADEHARALEPTLSKLTVAVTRPLPGLEVKVDGRAIAQGAWGVAVPMDAGRHTIEATAPDHAKYSGDVTLGANADQKTVLIPVLREAPRALRPVEAPRVEAGGGLGAGKIAAIAVGGAGAVSLGVGSYFGATALGKKGDPRYGSGCDANKNCQTGSPGLQLHRDAYTDATVSTILLGAGAACVVAAGVLWLLSPSGLAHSTRVGFDGRTILVRGSF